MVFSFSGLGSLAPEVRTPVVIRADSQRASQLDQHSRRLSWDTTDEREVLSTLNEWSIKIVSLQYIIFRLTSH